MYTARQRRRQSLGDIPATGGSIAGTVPLYQIRVHYTDAARAGLPTSGIDVWGDAARDAMIAKISADPSAVVDGWSQVGAATPDRFDSEGNYSSSGPVQPNAQTPTPPPAATPAIATMPALSPLTQASFFGIPNWMLLVGAGAAWWMFSKS